MARPPKPVDAEQVRQLAAIQCSYAEMAAVLKVNESTLTRRFAQVIQDGRSVGRMSLKRKQYEVAMDGNVPMLIWLGKQHLSQTDKQESTQVINIANTQPLTQEEKVDLIKKALNVPSGEK